MFVAMNIPAPRMVVTIPTIPMGRIDAFPVGGNVGLLGEGMSACVGVTVSIGSSVAVGAELIEGAIDAVGITVVVGCFVGIGVLVGVVVAEGVADCDTCVPAAKTTKDWVIVLSIPDVSGALIVIVCVPGDNGAVGRNVHCPLAFVVTWVCIA